jgi:hypothetical protein
VVNGAKNTDGGWIERFTWSDGMWVRSVAHRSISQPPRFGHRW